MRANSAPLLVIACMLTACANPVLRIEAPGYNAAMSQAPAREPITMAEALQKLNHVHARYYEAIEAQVGLSQDTVTGLVWLGTAVAGMAAGGVHRDAILGASLIGGTTYGLARTQLDARRLDIWSSGMEALDCAKEASLPLDIGPARTQALTDEIASSKAARQAVQHAVSAVRKAADAAPNGDLMVAPARAAADKAELAVADARGTEAAALRLLDAARGAELSATVDRVHTGVTKAVKDIAVDPRAIKQLVAGLGGFAEVLAPGSGVESLLGNAFAKYAASGKSADPTAHSGKVASPLDAPMDSLEQATGLLAASQKALAALLGDVSVAQVAAALKKCGITPPATAMVLTPAALQFAVGSAASKGFTISGGSQPYEVSALDTLPEGMTPVFRGGLADTAQVKVGDKVGEGEYRILVSDASNKKQQLVVTVGAKAPAGPGGSTGGTEADKANTAVTKPPASSIDPAWQALRKAMLPPFSAQIGSVTIKVAAADLVAGTLKVKLQCSPANAGLKALDVRERLAASDATASAVLRQAGALDKDSQQIDVSANGGCVRP